LPARGTEELLELTYQAQATPWLQLQPDIQYVINPGAGVAHPDDDTARLGNELMAGIRAITTF
jgi:porin